MANDLKVVHVVAAVVIADGKLLACRRAAHKSSGGKWEFPGGKVETGESSTEALKREIREELGLEMQPGTRLDITDTEIDGFCIRLETILCPLDVPFDVTSSDHDLFAWVLPQEMMALDWALPDLPAVALLADGDLVDRL
jgi:8-oxo-dGTP diphosphatase